jgi:uncharacterized protein (TIRG00374 family)
VTAHQGAAEALIRRPLAVVNRLRRHPDHEGRERVAAFVSQLQAARLRPLDGLAVAVYALLNWLLDAAGLWLCFYAVGGRPPTATAVLLAFCAAMAAGSVTIVPGGLGIVDSALVLGLAMGGAALPVVVAVVVLYRIVSFGFIIGLGWFFWLRLRGRPAAAPAPRTATAPPAGGGPRTDLRRLTGCPRRTDATVYAGPERRTKARV